MTLKLKGSDLAFVGYDGKWILEKGDFRKMCIRDRVYSVNILASLIFKPPLPIASDTSSGFKNLSLIHISANMMISIIAID